MTFRSGALGTNTLSLLTSDGVLENTSLDSRTLEDILKGLGLGLHLILGHGLALKGPRNFQRHASVKGVGY